MTRVVGGCFIQGGLGSLSNKGVLRAKDLREQIGARARAKGLQDVVEENHRGHMRLE